MESRWIRRDDVPLHGLWRPGEGTPLIMVPGVMADARSFVPVVEALGHPGPALILDRRGRSHSGEPGDDYSVETEVADLLAWIDSLDADVQLAGWSYGATIALEAAARDARIRGVVGYEPVLPPFGAELIPAVRDADLDRRVEIINIDLSRVPRDQVDALRTTPVWQDLRRLARPMAAELEALNAFEPDPAWADVSAQLIVGEASQGAEPYGPAFNRVVAHLPRATVSVLPGHGHLAHAADPVALGQLMGALVPAAT